MLRTKVVILAGVTSIISMVNNKKIPVTKEKFGLSKAARQINSRLDKSKLLENGFELLQTRKDVIRRYLEKGIN